MPINDFKQHKKMKDPPARKIDQPLKKVDSKKRKKNKQHSSFSPKTYVTTMLFLQITGSLLFISVLGIVIYNGIKIFIGN